MRLSLLALLSCLALAAAIVVSSESAPVISVPNVTAYVGDVVRVPVTIESGQDVAGVMIVMRFDRSVVSAVNVSSDVFRYFDYDIDNEAGVVRAVGIRTEGLGVSKVAMMYVTFRALREGTTVLDISAQASDRYGRLLKVSVVSGSIAVLKRAHRLVLRFVTSFNAIPVGAIVVGHDGVSRTTVVPENGSLTVELGVPSRLHVQIREWRNVTLDLSYAYNITESVDSLTILIPTARVISRAVADGSYVVDALISISCNGLRLSSYGTLDVEVPLRDRLVCNLTALAFNRTYVKHVVLTRDLAGGRVEVNITVEKPVERRVGPGVPREIAIIIGAVIVAAICIIAASLAIRRRRRTAYRYY